MPQRVRALLLCDTAAEFSGADRQVFEAIHGNAVAEAVRQQGVGVVMRRSFEALMRSLPLPEELPAGVRRFLEGLDCH